jgi:hypothetical protein
MARDTRLPGLCGLLRYGWRGLTSRGLCAIEIVLHALPLLAPSLPTDCLLAGEILYRPTQPQV